MDGGAALGGAHGGAPAGAHLVGDLEEAEAAFRDRYNTLKNVYEARLRAIVGQLKETMVRVQADPAVHALSADASTSVYVPARVEEVVDSALASEREAMISRLAEALAAREAELRGHQR